VGAHKSVAEKYGVTSLPHIVLFRKGHAPVKYTGFHTADALRAFVRKQLDPPAATLPTALDVLTFNGFHNHGGTTVVEPSEPTNAYGLESIRITVTGFFSDHEGMESDDYDDFRECAAALQGDSSIYFGQVLAPKTSTRFKRPVDVESIIGDDGDDVVPRTTAVGQRNSPWIIRTPSVILRLMSGGRTIHVEALTMDDFYTEGNKSLQDWVRESSVPPVAELTPYNFALYEKLNRPMLIMFLDLSSVRAEDGTMEEPYPEGAGPGQESASKSTAVFAANKYKESDKVKWAFRDMGTTNTVPNDALIQDLYVTALEHIGRLTFVYADGIAFEDKMRSLGILGGREQLPSLAFNTQDGRQYPYPPTAPIDSEALLQFCANFLSGRTQSGGDGNNALVKQERALRPTLKHAVHQPPKEAPEVTKGISERLDSLQFEAGSIVVLSSDNATSVLSQQLRNSDVLLLFHAEASTDCAHFAPYFKLLARRLFELELPGFNIARMDVEHQAPPTDFPINGVPTLYFLPAASRTPPFSMYAGQGKVAPMLEWVRAQFSGPFEWPELPQFDAEDRELYKEQITVVEQRRRNQGEL
jgi:thioredoxin-like negative regulator of GroEL